MARLDELREFLDYPNETLDVEYKSRLDLNDNEHKASLARHIAALANHGGGKIVFGFNDDLTVSASIPRISDISRDIVSGIVRRYLEPVLQCDVHFVKSSAGTDHPIIIVPSHGAAPVCAKASGPEKNGRPTGIVQGTYYIRKAGPCSDPILTSAEWQPLIRRCAMHDRAALLSAIAGAIEPSAASRDLEADLLAWHAATRREFDARIPQKKGSTNVGEHNLQLSYMVETEDSQRLPTSNFERVLVEINNEVRDFVQTGWSMLYLFDRRELTPYWRNDEGSGTDEDFLECSLVDQETIGDSADFWRASPDGRVSLIRDHWEDSPLVQKPQFEAYTRIDPQLLARSIGEIIRHARAFAGRFDTPVRIAFRCEWRGLLGRKAQRLGGYSFVFGREAKTNERSSHGVWSVLELAQHWERAAEELAAPVARSLGIENALSAEQLLKLAETWDRLG
jgi:hypothetical protein